MQQLLETTQDPSKAPRYFLVQEMLNEAQAANNTPEAFIEKRRNEILQHLQTVQQLIVDTVISQSKEHPEFFIHNRRTEIIRMQAKTGILHQPDKKIVARSVLSGSTTPPVYTREEPQQIHEQPHIPILNVVYLTELEVGMIENTNTFNRIREFAAALALISLSEINAQLEKAGLSVKEIRVQYQIVIAGGRGSRSVFLDITPEYSERTVAEVLHTINTIANTIHLDQGDEFCATPIMRHIIHFEELLQRSKTESTIPFISRYSLWANNKTIRDNRSQQSLDPEEEAVGTGTVFAVEEQLQLPGTEFVHPIQIYVS